MLESYKFNVYIFIYKYKPQTNVYDYLFFIQTPQPEFQI